MNESPPAAASTSGGLRRPRTLLALLGLALLVILAGSWLTDARKADAAAVHTGAAVVVDAATVSRSDVPLYLDGLGTIQALYTDTITARVDGELQRVAFTEGAVVRKGAVLAQIDPRPYQAVLDQARATEAKDAAQLASARRDLERYTLLAPEELASKQTLDDQRGVVAALEAQLRVDAAAVESARTQLGYTTITSPIPGRTGIRLVDPGNIVHAADSGGIVVVTQVQPISCILTLPEDQVANLSAALRAGPVTVTALSRDGRTELDQGVVSLIDNQIDQTTGMIRVKAQFPNLRNTLWPGEFVNARVLLRTLNGALTVPTAAIQRGSAGLFVYVVRADSTVEMRPVKTAQENAGSTVVTEGLQGGERVVTSNHFRLQPGAHVRRAARD